MIYGCVLKWLDSHVFTENIDHEILGYATS